MSFFEAANRTVKRLQLRFAIHTVIVSTLR
jgi:hypothetical protein